MRSVQVASLSLGHVNVLIKLIIRWTRVRRVNNVIIMTGLMRIKLDYSYSQLVGRLTSFEDYVIFIFISKCVTEITQIKMQNFNDEVRLMLSAAGSNTETSSRPHGVFKDCRLMSGCSFPVISRGMWSIWSHDVKHVSQIRSYVTTDSSSSDDDDVNLTGEHKLSSCRKVYCFCPQASGAKCLYMTNILNPQTYFICI